MSKRLLGMLASILAVSVLSAIAGIRLLSLEPELGAHGVFPRELDPQERAYVEFVQPRLTALDAEAANLVVLGEQRSQNALALLQGQRRVEVLIADLSAYIERHGVPAAFEASAREFASGAQQARESIRDGRAALTRLDWEQLEAAVEEFSLAADSFSSAANALIGEATRAAL